MQESPAVTIADKNAGATVTLAKPLAPEDVRPGDFVAILHQTVEVPSFFWNSEEFQHPRDELVRMQIIPDEGGLPLKVMSVCLPYVFVKAAAGNTRTLDVRKHQLARLDRNYAKTVWKTRKKQNSTNLLRGLLA